MWKYRTFRTVLDPASSEYSETSMEQKINYLQALKDNDMKLSELIRGYKKRYIEQGRKDIAIESENALIGVIEYLLAERSQTTKG